MEKAVIGLNDIAWGQGKVTVPTYGGQTREIDRINLSNIPYDESRTLGQVLEEFTTLFTTNDYQVVSENIQGLQGIIQRLNRLTKLSDNMSNILRLDEALPTLQSLSSHLTQLLAVNSDVAEVKAVHRDLKYLVTRFSNIEKCYLEDINKATKLVREKIDPLQAQQLIITQTLNDMVQTAVAEVQAGNEVAIKFATYTMVVYAKPQCRQPRMIFDDVHQKIIFEIPTVKGDCVVCKDSISPAVVAEAVDEHLAGLALLGAGGLGAHASQDEVNEVIGIKDLTIQFSGNNADNTWELEEDGHTLTMYNNSVVASTDTNNFGFMVKSKVTFPLVNNKIYRLDVNIELEGFGYVMAYIDKANGDNVYSSPHLIETAHLLDIFKDITIEDGEYIIRLVGNKTSGESYQIEFYYALTEIEE